MVFQICGLTVLVFFYGIYIGKMALQKKRGIQTNQMARGNKTGKLFWTELLMKLAAYLAVLAEGISIIRNFSCLPSYIRWIGFGLGITGTVFFTLAVYTMKDSWRAGIPDHDKTEFVTAGIYGFSRNPAFLGFDFMHLGLLLMFFHPGLLVCTCFSVIMLHLQILQEESFLHKTFGGQYESYKSQVKRYWGRR